MSFSIQTGNICTVNCGYEQRATEGKVKETKQLSRSTVYQNARKT